MAKSLLLLFPRCSRPLCEWRIASHSCSFSTLPTPSVIYSNNHICVINKPAGWHSVPNKETQESSKCLLTWLKDKQLGGGSDGRFLLPLHRIDQPCTGVLVYAKNSKAATRITQEWKRKKVEKTYWCVMPESGTGTLNLDSDWNKMTGLLVKNRKSSVGQGKGRRGGWSVVMKPWKEQDEAPKGTRICHIEYKNISSAHNLIEIKTTGGARHMVRALLAQVGKCPVVGDVRYGSDKTLPDRSVALHARSITFAPSLKLGGLETRHFVAPLPPTWREYFGLTEDTLTDKKVDQ